MLTDLDAVRVTGVRFWLSYSVLPFVRDRSRYLDRSPSFEPTAGAPQILLKSDAPR
jgi:hypothetical protein